MGESSLIEGGKDWQVDFVATVKVKWKNCGSDEINDFGWTSFMDDPK